MFWRLRVQALGFLLLVVGLVSGFATLAADDGPVATRALGKLDLVHNGINIVDNAGLWNPHALAIDRSVTPYRLYVVDAGNHRVLGWHSIAALTNGIPADLVIRQVDFLSWHSQCTNAAVNAETLCSPSAVAVDGAGNLLSMSPRLLSAWLARRSWRPAMCKSSIRPLSLSPVRPTLLAVPRFAELRGLL
jgi:hypothetical protein